MRRCRIAFNSLSSYKIAHKRLYKKMQKASEEEDGKKLTYWGLQRPNLMHRSKQGTKHFRFSGSCSTHLIIAQKT